MDIGFFKKQYKSLIRKYSTKYVRVILDTGYEINVSTSKFHTNELVELLKQTKYIKNKYQCIPSEHFILTKDTGKRTRVVKSCYYGKVNIVSKEISKIIKFITKHFKVVSKITLHQYSQNLISKLVNKFKDRNFILLRYNNDNLLTLVYYNNLTHNCIDNEPISEEYVVRNIQDIIDVLETYSYPCIINLTNNKDLSTNLSELNISQVCLGVKGLKLNDVRKSFLLQDIDNTEISINVKSLPEDSLDEDLLHKSFVPKRIVKRNNRIYSFIVFMLCALFLYIGIQYGTSLIDDSFWSIPETETFSL